MDDSSDSVLEVVGIFLNDFYVTSMKDSKISQSVEFIMDHMTKVMCELTFKVYVTQICILRCFWHKIISISFAFLKFPCIKWF